MRSSRVAPARFSSSSRRPALGLRRAQGHHTSNWEALHHLIKVLERDGIAPAGDFLQAALSRPDGAVDADLVKELAHLLFRIAERQRLDQGRALLQQPRHQLAGDPGGRAIEPEARSRRRARSSSTRTSDMALSNRDRIDRMFEVLAPALDDFISSVIGAGELPSRCRLDEARRAKDSKNGHRGQGRTTALDPQVQFRMLTEATSPHT